MVYVTGSSMNFWTMVPVFRSHYHVTVGTLYNLSMPWFSFYEWCNNTAYLLRLLRRLNEPIYVMCLVHSLAHSKQYISAILLVVWEINWGRRKFILKGNMNSRGRGERKRRRKGGRRRRSKRKGVEGKEEEKRGKKERREEERRLRGRSIYI